MMGAYTDTFPTVNTEFAVDLGLPAADTDRLGRTALETVDTALSQIRIQPDRMIEFMFQSSVLLS